MHGGRDLREGSLDTMWRLDLDSVLRACEDSNYPAQWEQIAYKGNNSSNGAGPGKISHHRCGVVTGDKMVLVGGVKGEDASNRETWIFDLKSN